MIERHDEMDRNRPKPKSGLNGKTPAEGPHARSDLQDTEKTPGTGALPDRKSEVDVGPD
ncbi:hypothetical protein [Nitratireductor basaltis]|uniref:Uncharacterized protein n=1 Tax=Nitratireductor basaltis TaxID=472175 RepID=A0A084UAR6_9HYPH|nr:hypothetical protein [Nitratireductor basaltis]KFB10052.1 hypothetical protein EL18_01080 [Nitratireductor basaltis]